MKATLEIYPWNRDLLRHILTHDPGGEGTGGGQTMCGTGWDECADFTLPDGRCISVMFSVDDSTATIGVFDHAASDPTLLRYEGEPAEALTVLIDSLVALGHSLPR
ncbi:hypothetical protein GCM10008955_36790 [Deinococcus malanensis]|uniref:Uncharacterized protein n=1 Tax=Deinococcus malanensis TaxID=1706855 RepID=A0ABQ2F4N5_9DEIO|nr:hypothetical protein [Deinococcus malanensis]GGK39610.1 hypothetical protein GCM10008955_36790 [Deinococcus malanensis]